MKIKTLITLALTALLLHTRATATVHYVDLNSPNPTPPFTDWSTAATNIQDAVDASVAGDLVLVTNGIYATGGTNYVGITYRVTVTNALTLESVNGPLVTVIDGGYAMPCVYLTNGCVLQGFTVTHGGATNNYNQPGGGVVCGGNVDANDNLLPGSAQVINCIVNSNLNRWFGAGGVSWAIVSNSTVSYNLGPGYGCGGAFVCTIYNSVLSQNVGGEYAAGAYDCLLNNCLIFTNLGIGVALSSLNNCLVVSNAFFGASSCFITNCTVCGNRGDFTTMHPYGPFSVIWNSIVFYNLSSGGTSGNYGNYITNAPLFVNIAAGDFHLASNSPCINAGNNIGAISSTDLDGNPRIVGGTVDLGAYEYQSPTSILPYWWAQQYGLPTDGSADYADTDHTGMNNWQKWIAGLNPTNALSVLKMYSPTNGPAGLVVAWQSVSNRTYFLQRATNLVGPGAFTAIASNLTIPTPTNTHLPLATSISFTDTTATAQAPYFYRVGVQSFP